MNSNKDKQLGEVLVVHCVDTEGPIGGDVRRRPDGTKEFYDSWEEIEASMDWLMSDAFRSLAADSYGSPYLYNWFIMDFMGFSTNPKRRVAKYHDTWDHFKAMSSGLDGFYWHYHHPPTDGVGDAWSDSWSSSDEYLNILLHRLVEREVWPEAFRAGGTIEDNEASLWLEDVVMVDYSNRVSGRSRPTDNIFDFNWYGAPDRWGYYHPSRKNLVQEGDMRRYIVRSVDLWSRLHVLTLEEVREAFEVARDLGESVILSYFTHDHREMKDETMYAVGLINQVAKETGVKWRSCQALEALQECGGMTPVTVKVRWERMDDGVEVVLSDEIYQKQLWVGAKMSGGDLRWMDVEGFDGRRGRIVDVSGAERLIVGGTSLTGDSFVDTFEV